MKQKPLIFTGAAAAVTIGLLCAFTLRPGDRYLVPELTLVPISVQDGSIPNFDVAFTETTNEQYATFLSAVGRGSGVWFTKYGSEPGDLPARDLTKDNAIEYCRWLTIECRLRGLIKKNQAFNLPTDAQFSAILGLKPGAEQGTTPEERSKKATLGSFPHGLDAVPPTDAANVLRNADSNAKPSPTTGFTGNSDGYMGVAPVGRFRVAGSPVADIEGNVAEMIRESFNNVVGGPVCGRGGSYKSDSSSDLRVSARESVPAAASLETLGFRVVLETLPQSN